MCDSGIDILSVFTIIRLSFEIVQTVLSFVWLVFVSLCVCNVCVGLLGGGGCLLLFCFLFVLVFVFVAVVVLLLFCLVFVFVHWFMFYALNFFVFTVFRAEYKKERNIISVTIFVLIVARIHKMYIFTDIKFSSSHENSIGKKQTITKSNNLEVENKR